jgi:hypothetical protein
MGIVLHPITSCLPHPDEEVLEAYVLHRLPEALTAPVEEHLLICHRCQDAVAAIDQFVASLKSAGRPSASPVASPVLSGFRSMAPIAAALVLSALVVVWKYPHGAPVSPVTVTLSSLRAAHPPSPAPAGKPLNLSIEMPDLKSEEFYRVEVVDAAGSMAWRGPVTESDGKLIATVSRPLSDGVYWVRLYGANSELLREFGLSAQ